MNERYSDYGTQKQINMLNRMMLGDERGGTRKAYVKSNMDIIREFDNSIIDDLQHEIGKTYWAWRTIARKTQGYGENPTYGDRIDDEGEPEPIGDTATEAGAIREMFIILCGLMNQDYLNTVDACCQDADSHQPCIIIQSYQQLNLRVITWAFMDLEKQLYAAKKIFEKRLDAVSENA